MFLKRKWILWLTGVLLCNVLKAQLPLPVDGPCGESATIAGVVNTYYPGLNNVNAGDLAISLGEPAGNTLPLLQGDRVLIIQVQDAAINAVNTAAYGGNGTNGNGYTDLGFSGLYEFGEVSSFAGGLLTLRNPLQHSYRAVSGIPNRKSAYQVIRVPAYKNVTLTGPVMAAPWNGLTGGVVAFHAWQTLDMNGYGITVTGLGFRPGRINSAGGGYNLQDYVSATYGSYGEKGEGIAGTPAGTWTATAGGYENGSFARGAPANAGGGGNAHNSGGGGGANYGDGGKGGYQYSGPQDVGGRGGKGIKTGLPARIIMGGGGGGGHQNNMAATGGGHGGGIILITANTIIGAGIVSADGISAGPSADDGAGGGGAGGSIMLAYNGALPGSITFTAKGGNGGNETFLARHGSGGGGGGGVIITSTPVAGTDVSGGIRGLSNGTEWGTADGEPGTVMNMDLTPLFPVSTRLPLLVVKEDTTVCAPATVDITSSAVITDRDQGPQYVLTFWEDAAATIPLANPQAVDKPGTYYIRLANTGTKCETIASLQVTIHPQPVLTLTATPPLCAGNSNGSITPAPANGTGPYEYSSNGGQTWQSAPVNNLPAGTYNIVTRDRYGCISGPASIVLTDPPLLTLQENTAGHANVLCNGARDGQLQFTAAGGTSGYVYTVSSPETGNTSNSAGLFTRLPAGSYAVTVTDAQQCMQQTTAVIQEPPVLNIALIAQTGLRCDALPIGSITLTANGGVPPYWFSIGENSWQRDSMFSKLGAGTYSIVVKDGNDCITPPLTTDIKVEEDCEIFFPSAFTPNGDGKNDLFRPKYYKSVSNYRLKVYNRWGAIVFESNDPANGWNGQYKGALSGTATFVWVATFVNRQGQPQVLRGTVTLVE